MPEKLPPRIYNVWRYHQSGRRYRYSLTAPKGRQAKKQASICGRFERLYDPETGGYEPYYTYWGNGSWPQPDYGVTQNLRPTSRSEEDEHAKRR